MLRKPRRMADALKALRFAAKLAWAANPTALLINLVARLMGAVIPAATVHITALLVSAVQNSPDAGPRPVVFLACLQTGVFLLQFGLNTVSGLSSQLASEQTTNHVLGLVAEQVQCYRFDERQTTSFNENLAFIRYSAAQRCYQPISQFIDTTGSVISLISVLTVMSRANWVIGLVVLLATGPTLYATLRSTRLQMEAARSQSSDRFKSEYFYRVLSSREYAAEVKLYQASGFLLSQWRHHNQRALNTLWSVMLKQTTLESPGQFINAIAAAASTILLGLWVQRGELTLGNFVASTQGILAVQGAAAYLYRSLAGLLQTGLYIDRLRTFLIAAHGVPGLAGDPTPALGAGHQVSAIELKDLSYCYPGSAAAALSGVTTHFPAGSVSVVVGPNGAGKTTLLYVLAGLLTPGEGSIYIEPSLRLGGARRAGTAIVPQEFTKYNLPLYENVALAHAEVPGDLADGSPVVRSLLAAGGRPILERIGLDAPLGPEMNEGAELSRGEWQRVAIARALMRNPRLLLLDEPTANADPQQREAVLKLIEDRRGCMTIVVVTHDLSLAKMADQVLMLDRGRLVARGKHQDLVYSSDWYRWLFSQGEAHGEEEMEAISLA